jgi:hypothetical protein
MSLDFSPYIDRDTTKKCDEDICWLVLTVDVEQSHTTFEKCFDLDGFHRDNPSTNLGYVVKMTNSMADSVIKHLQLATARGPLSRAALLENVCKQLELTERYDDMSVILRLDNAEELIRRQMELSS